MVGEHAGRKALEGGGGVGFVGGKRRLLGRPRALLVLRVDDFQEDGALQVLAELYPRILGPTTTFG